MGNELLLFFVSPVQAEKALSAYDIADNYGNQETSVKTLVLDSEAAEPVIAISAVTMIDERCTGEFAGIGTLKGNKLTVTPYRKSEDSKNCVITMEFDKKGKRVKMSESDCMGYHGAVCGFGGTLTAGK